MIFHSRIPENKVQSYIVITFYERVYCAVFEMVVSVLSHYLVLGREAAINNAALQRKRKVLTAKRRPIQVASTFGSYRSGLRPIGSCWTTQFNIVFRQRPGLPIMADQDV